ncbi:hypothetical protein CEP52_015812 [Fusarium oligoseptatum]|uniref:Uncharacterized protein n=1 Tax=Fusarium oligoseptatum TaxID=2604345 RepID=A0A428S9B9_9HYPO|nr:hypothetical protein CEP52_015812 [Fusarium oligoseptatum]
MADNTKFTSKLHGSRILVVGGSAGVGYAVAEASVEQGAAAIIISSSNSGRVESSVARLQRSYPSKAERISGVACNLAQEDKLETNIVALLDAATNNGAQKLDHIAYTAGDAPIPKALGDVDLDYIKGSFLVRSFAAMLFGQACLKVSGTRSRLQPHFDLGNGFGAAEPKLARPDGSNQQRHGVGNSVSARSQADARQCRGLGRRQHGNLPVILG